MPAIEFDMSFFLTVIVIAAIVYVLAGVKQVPQGFEYTVLRFGQYVRTLRPGLHFVWPIVMSVGNKQNMMEQVLDVPTQDVITKDNAMVAADAIAFYQVMNAARATYEVNDLDYAIVNLSMTNIRTVLGSMDLDELLSKRDDINSRLLSVIDAATNPWGVKVTRVEIKDLSPPRDITEAMARQMKAEREKRAEILQAEGERNAAILRAEGEKQSAILEAEGRREAAFRDAEAREREAEAEARATTMVSDAIAKGDVQAVNYFVAQKYVEAFGKLATSPQQRTVIIPMEATNVLGSLAGVMELTKAAHSGSDETPTPTPGGAGRGPSVPSTRGPWR